MKGIDIMNAIVDEINEIKVPKEMIDSEMKYRPSDLSKEEWKTLIIDKKKHELYELKHPESKPIYVDSKYGDDENCGDMNHPLKTLKNALKEKLK